MGWSSAVGLTKVWIRTLSDGLLRADQVTGVSCHSTPAIAGNSAHWLLTASVAVPAGSGNRDGWDIADLHRTLAQVGREAPDAPDEFVRTLAELSDADVAGIISPVIGGEDRSEVRFEFTPFKAQVGAHYGTKAAQQPVRELIGAADAG